MPILIGRAGSSAFTLPPEPRHSVATRPAMRIVVGAAFVLALKDGSCTVIVITFVVSVVTLQMLLIFGMIKGSRYFRMSIASATFVFRPSFIGKHRRSCDDCGSCGYGRFQKKSRRWHCIMGMADTLGWKIRNLFERRELECPVDESNRMRQLIIQVRSCVPSVLWVQCCSISSRFSPLVSGTNRQKTMVATRQMAENVKFLKVLKHYVALPYS